MMYTQGHMSFKTIQAELRGLMFATAKDVHTEKWQGLDIKDKPEAAMKELSHISFKLFLVDDLEYQREKIKPNLPWADDHFEERVGGEPLNPGETWKTWPWAKSANEHRTEGEQFTHTYMERFWPRYAGESYTYEPSGHGGIRYRYGDLADVVKLLLREPLTRQACLPIYFPEDTGSVHGGRVPCSMYYQFRFVDGVFNITYPIRSCDYSRHFRDDVFLAIRLLFWMRDKLAEEDSWWEEIEIFSLWMNIESLHMFINDWKHMFRKERKDAQN